MVCIQKLFFIIIITLFLVFGCAGVKTEQKIEQKPLSPVEEKVELPKKEEAPPPQPTPDIHPKPSPPPAQPPAVYESPRVIPSTQPSLSLTSPLRTTKIAWDSVNLRGGPGLNYKVIGNVKKGTPLSVFEDKGSWLRVRLQDGSEAWVSKAATTETPKTTPEVTSKPKPM